MQKLNHGLSYFLFFSFAILLIIFRMPWVDESWVAGPVVTFMRYGSFLDFGMCRGGTLAHAYHLELYALLQAVWVFLGDFNLVWCRFFNVIMGLFFLLTIDRCLKIADISQKICTIAIALGGINYFFLYAATQNRPEAAALFTSALSLIFYLNWRNNFENYWYLSFSNALIIVSTLLHLQGAFTGLSLWVATFIVDRKLLKKNQILAFFIPYVVTFFLIGMYLYPQWRDFIDFLYRIFVNNKMLGHSGGMVFATLNYWNKHEFAKLLVSLVLIVLPTLGMIAFIKKNENKVRMILLIFASGGYVSWLCTTAHINDYHASWLSLALILSVVGAVENLQNTNNLLTKTRMISIISLMLVLGIYSTFFVFNTVISNPYKNIYDFDLDYFSSKYGLTKSQVGGVRDIQWYFKFDPQILCVSKLGFFPEYYIVNNEVGAKADDTYHFLEKGRGFSIYRKNRLA